MSHEKLAVSSEPNTESQMDFTAIDFETANHRRDSACQLAAVVVRDGQMVDRHMWMIKPRPFYFSPRNIEVHGIRPSQVERELEFGELWEAIAPHLTGTCLVAHNAPFDLGVLMECIRVHGHSVPPLQFTCTRLIARAAWPGRNGYGLKPVSDWLGIQFRHHDALEDSVACAKILLAAAATTSSDSLEQLETKLKLARGHADETGYQGATKQKPLRRAKMATRRVETQVNEERIDYETVSKDESVDLQRLFIRAEFLRRLAGQQVVFTGKLKCISRESAEMLATKLGATLQDRVTRSTNVVVVGIPDERTVFSGRAQSHKEQMALSLRSEGHPITLMTEAEFIGLVQHVDVTLASE